MHTVDGAILDGRLTDGDVTPVALRLISELAPLVFHWGTGMPAAVAACCPNLPVLIKPVSAVTVAEVLWAEFQRLGRISNALGP
jgi:hypothetical protein